MADTADASPERPFVERVAARAAVEPDEVRDIMLAYAVPPATVPAARRSLAVDWLRLRGTKSGIPGSGSFDTTLRFPRGVVMIAGSNFTGKTSVLEILTLCLRGTARDLQVDVERWLETVECGIEVNGQPHTVTLRFTDARLVQGTLDRKETSSGPPTRMIEASTAYEWADKLTAFMLDRLALTALTVRTRSGDHQVHSWPSYFGAIYPAAGGERVLIGDTVQAALAGRLLTVFLDLPSSALLPRIRAARDQAQHDNDTAQAAEQARRRMFGVNRARYEQVVAQTREALAALDSAPAPPSATDLAMETGRLSSRLADLERSRLTALETLEQATADRRTDERRLNDHVESEAARVLFHGLEPTNCPRCEAAVTDERRHAEVTGQICSVCVTPVANEIVVDERDDVTAELRATLAASRRAEEGARAERERVAADYESTASELAGRDRELREARASRDLAELARLERVLARAEGALEALADPEPPADDNSPRDDLVVLRALCTELEEDQKAASQAVFDPLQAEIVSLAHAFGIGAVTEVRITRAAQLAVTKGGGTAPFSKQSPGERLRLRIALIVALLRVGRRSGLATHPGLVLLDSLRAEEVDDDDARALLGELVAVSQETPGFQLITTSTDVKLARAFLPAGSVITPADGVEAVW